MAALLHRAAITSLTNPHDALDHGVTASVLQTKVDARCDKLATELS